ncbi:MAG: hypothetical protein ACFHU9_12220 [Fluviicola sp.]
MADAIHDLLLTEGDSFEKFMYYHDIFVDEREVFEKEVLRRIQPESFDRFLKEEVTFDLPHGEVGVNYIYSDEDMEYDVTHGYDEYAAWLNWCDRKKKEFEKIKGQIQALEFKQSRELTEASVDFKAYFKDGSIANELIPLLKTQLDLSKAKNVVAMCFALDDLGYTSLMDRNSSDLTKTHSALEKCFGKVGARSSLNRNRQIIEENRSSGIEDHYERLIQITKSKIKDLLK